jgi:parallel beta-helix repeat protein
MRTPVAFGLAAAIALSLMGGTASASAPCDLVASPAGSDTASGTVSAPFQTAQKLVDSLTPGQVGCLKAGTYGEDVKVSVGGRSGAPVTLTSYPGQTATVTGRLWIAQGANYVTVTGLNLNGRNSDALPSPTVNADHATFSYDDVTNDHTAICFLLGSGWGTATGTLITNNRIHDCGVLPAANHEHGIYVEDATNTTIAWNLIYNNADRGIQLYPHPVGTTIDHNVIANNGEGIIFGSDGGSPATNSSNVYANVVTNAQIRHDVESSGNAQGTGNSFHRNCVWGGAQGTIDTSGGGFTAQDNTTANPQYVNPAAGDYHLGLGSPCLAIAGDIAAVVDGSPATQPASPAATAKLALAGKAGNRSHRRHLAGIALVAHGRSGRTHATHGRRAAKHRARHGARHDRARHHAQHAIRHHDRHSAWS